MINPLMYELFYEVDNLWEHVSGGEIMDPILGTHIIGSYTTGEILKHKTRDNLFMVRTGHIGCYRIYTGETTIGNIVNGKIVE